MVLVYQGMDFFFLNENQGMDFLHAFKEKWRTHIQVSKKYGNINWHFPLVPKKSYKCQHFTLHIQLPVEA